MAALTLPWYPGCPPPPRAEPRPDWWVNLVAQLLRQRQTVPTARLVTPTLFVPTNVTDALPYRQRAF